VTLHGQKHPGRSRLKLSPRPPHRHSCHSTPRPRLNAPQQARPCFRPPDRLPSLTNIGVFYFIVPRLTALALSTYRRSPERCPSSGSTHTRSSMRAARSSNTSPTVTALRRPSTSYCPNRSARSPRWTMLVPTLLRRRPACPGSCLTCMSARPSATTLPGSLRMPGSAGRHNARVRLFSDTYHCLFSLSSHLLGASVR